MTDTNVTPLRWTLPVRLHKLLAVVNVDRWGEHFEAPATESDEVVRRANDELAPIGVTLAIIRPTLAELPPDDDPAITPHRYTAHDSGFMQFAVELDVLGRPHAVDPSGETLAYIDDVKGKTGRELTHELVDLVADKMEQRYNK